MNTLTGTTLSRVLGVTGKRVTRVEKFESGEEFGAYRLANGLLVSEGYTVGSMCCPQPTAAARGLEYVAKWNNIQMSDWSRIEAVIISDDSRNGPVTVYFLGEVI